MHNSHFAGGVPKIRKKLTISHLSVLEANGTTGALTTVMNTEANPIAESIHTIKAQAEMTKNSVKQTARELVDRITGGSWLRIGERKQAAAEHLDTATSAVLEAANRLKSDNQDVVARPLVGLAETVGQFSCFLETNSPKELADKAADTVRRYPLASLAVALVVGAAAARIVRASSKS